MLKQTVLDQLTSDYTAYYTLGKDEYYVRLYTHDKGLYSGVSYNKGRLRDFILDFSTGYFRLGGK